MKYYINIIIVLTFSVYFNTQTIRVEVDEPITEIVQNSVKAFPTAYGGGSNATGGRSGDLIIVNTNSKDAQLVEIADFSGRKVYNGGFITALQHPNPAHIIFNSSMNIDLGVGGVNLTGVNNKTILGQTAPEGGVTIHGGTFRINGRFGDGNNLIFRYLRSRPILDRNGNQGNNNGIADDDAYTWSFLFYGGNDIIVDHCSASFAYDKAIGGAIDQLHVAEGSTMYRHTYSSNLIADSHTSAYVEVNPDRANDPERFVDNISFLGGLIIGNNRTPNMAFEGYGEIKNVISLQTPTKFSTVYHGLNLNYENNYLQTNNTAFNRITLNGETGVPSIYSNGNNYNGSIPLNQRDIWNEGGSTIPPANDSFFVSQPHTTSIANEWPLLTAQESYNRYVNQSNVGANKYLDNNGNLKTYQDPFDLQMLEVAKGNQSYDWHRVSNWVLPLIPQNTRPSNYDTDNDGLADAWEISNFGNITAQDFGGDPDNDGYENIEELANGTDPNNATNSANNNRLVKHQAVFEELIQAPEVARRHRDGYSFEYYQNDIIQNRFTLLSNYMAEVDHELWDTDYFWNQSVLPKTGNRQGEPYFSGASPSYDNYSEYTNALHVAAQYAYLFSLDEYSGVNVTINGTTKLADNWVEDISLKVLADLTDVVTDPNLNIYDSAKFQVGTVFTPNNPYFVAISKASAMWDSFALISQTIPDNTSFINEQRAIYDWLVQLGVLVEAGLDGEYDYYVPDWENFGNYEDTFRNASLTAEVSYSQKHYYYNSAGVGQDKIQVSADVGNNRNMGSLEYLFKTATYANNTALRSKCEDYLRRVMESTSKDGIIVDIQRNNGAGTISLNYSHIVVAEIAMIVAHDANSKLNRGDIATYSELYDRIYPEGIEDRFPTLPEIYATANPNKGAKFIFNAHSDWINNQDKYGFDGNLLGTETGTMTVHALIGQMFEDIPDYSNYLSSFNNTNTYSSSLWGNESLAAWHKWETVFGGVYSLSDFPNLYKRAAELRANNANTFPILTKEIKKKKKFITVN